MLSHVAQHSAQDLEQLCSSGPITSCPVPFFQFPSSLLQPFSPSHTYTCPRMSPAPMSAFTSSSPYLHCLAVWATAEWWTTGLPSELAKLCWASSGAGPMLTLTNMLYSQGCGPSFQALQVWQGKFVLGIVSILAGLTGGSDPVLWQSYLWQPYLWLIYDVCIGSMPVHRAQDWAVSYLCCHTPKQWKV